MPRDAQASRDLTTPSFGMAVRAARAARGVSLREVAEQLGVSAATLSLLETGKTQFTVDRLVAVARILDIDLGELLAADAETPDIALQGGGPLDWRAFPPSNLAPIQAAALDCFADRGYVGSSIRDIAKAAGMSISGIYHHYASKHDILESLVEMATLEALERAHAARAQGNGPVERFTLVVESLCLFHLQRRKLSLVSVNELRHLNPSARKRISVQRWAVQELIDEEIHAAIAAGDFHATDALEVGRAVMMLASALPRRFPDDRAGDFSAVSHIYTGFALRLVGHRES